MRRIARSYEDLKLRDAVARHLNTHPFDERVTSLSRLQAQLFLELRHPSDNKALEDKAIEDADKLRDQQDLYRYGEVKIREEPTEDIDYAIDAQ